MPMLHVTNGTVALSRIHALGIGGEVIAWDDVLHEGPVPAGLGLAEMRELRAAFLAEFDAGPAAEISRAFEARDRALEAARGEIVLWFEHDLYDQLQVLQVLDRLTPEQNVTTILADDYLGTQSDHQLRAWFHARRPLAAEEWQAAAEAWRLFRDPDPTGLSGFEHPGAWDSLRSSIRRHLQQFPAVGTGLSRTERQTLAALTSRRLTPRELFLAANHAVEEAVFMGDWGWWSHIRPLAVARRPLIRIEGEVPAAWHHADWWRDDESAPRVSLTGDGEQALGGTLDRVEVNGLDRWLGGVHLRGDGPMWRWDERSKSVAIREPGAGNRPGAAIVS